MSWMKGKDIWARTIQLAAFSVSCYLTMGMFSALVAGVTKIWIFRAFGLIYETSKLSILQRSFMVRNHRLVMRFLALILMTVSVSGAVLSAIKDTMIAEADDVTSISATTLEIEELIAQRDAWQTKLNGLSPEYRTSSIAYGQEIKRLQEQINATRAKQGKSKVSLAKTSGVFEEASVFLLDSRISPNLLRLIFFIVFILLNEAVLYFETYLVSIEGGERETALDKIKRWKIFHQTPTMDLIREEVRAKVEEIQSRPVAGKVDSLF